MTVHIFTFQLHTKKRAYDALLYDSQVASLTVRVERKSTEFRHRVRRTSTLLLSQARIRQNSVSQSMGGEPLLSRSREYFLILI